MPAEFKLPERVREQKRRASARWRAKNHERNLEITRQWRKANPDKVRANKLKWRQANPEKIRLHDRNKKLKRVYGIDIQTYAQMLESQGGVCAICGKGETRSTSKNLQVDHCHNSSRVRGLLCFKCNTALGSFEDNPQLLVSAIAYLTS
jgi:hypothetical protein